MTSDLGALWTGFPWLVATVIQRFHGVSHSNESIAAKSAPGLERLVRRLSSSRSYVQAVQVRPPASTSSQSAPVSTPRPCLFRLRPGTFSTTRLRGLPAFVYRAMVVLPIVLRCASLHADAGNEYFKNKVRPLLHHHCSHCHGERIQCADIDLRKLETVLGTSAALPSIRWPLTH